MYGLSGGQLNWYIDGQSGGLSVDVSVQVSVQIVSVFMKSRVQWRNYDAYAYMHKLTMADSTALLAAAVITITKKCVESNGVKVVEAEYCANNG